MTVCTFETFSAGLENAHGNHSIKHHLHKQISGVGILWLMVFYQLLDGLKGYFYSYWNYRDWYGIYSSTVLIEYSAYNNDHASSQQFFNPILPGPFQAILLPPSLNLK